MYLKNALLSSTLVNAVSELPPLIWLRKGKVERHCPPQTGKRAQNRFTDNPEHPRRLPSSFLPPSLLPFTPNVAVHTPTPRIREVETTSRHFVCADRPSETGGDNRETERLWQPTATAPGTVAAGTSGEILSVSLREGKHHRKDKTSEDGKPESVIYMCAWEGNTPKNPRKGVFVERREAEEGNTLS